MYSIIAMCVICPAVNSDVGKVNWHIEIDIHLYFIVTILLIKETNKGFFMFLT